MPGGKELTFLWDILDAARTIHDYVSGVSEESFFNNTLLQDAVIRRFEIIGEAAARISETTRTTMPGIPWQQMVGMRHRLFHEYDNVRVDVVWESTQKDLLPLIAALAWVENVERLGENF